MELFNFERTLHSPPNYGEKIFHKIERNKLAETGYNLAVSENVRVFLEQNPSPTGPLNATAILDQLTNDELCIFFSMYPSCETLILRDWIDIEPAVLRAISVTMGESLLELDVSGSSISLVHFEILLAFMKKLKVLRISKCCNIDGITMSVLTKVCSHTMTELYADMCPTFRVEPLLWMTGFFGNPRHKFGFLRVLDLAEGPVEDKALCTVATACKHLRYLNLYRCFAVTDIGACAIVSASSKLKVLNLGCISNLTNKTVFAVGSNCPNLVSINISQCVKITDKGIRALCTGCVKLQALSIAGLKKISEMGAYYVADNCKGLLMLNITGCEEITVNGLSALIQGMNHVEPARTFTGFKPVDEHVSKKLASQLMMIKEASAAAQREKEQAQDRQAQAQEEAEAARRNWAAYTITAYLRRYRCRMHFYWMWIDKRRTSGAVFVQRAWRGILGRRRAEKARIRRGEYLRLAPAIIALQSVVRGKQSRRANTYVNEVLVQLYATRKREANVGMAVKFQSCGRRFLAKKRVRVWREFRSRRWADEERSARTIQRLCGGWLAIRRYRNRKRQEKEVFEVRRRAARKIQKFVRHVMNKVRARAARQEVLRLLKLRFLVTCLLQRVVRGHWGRKRAHRERIKRATEYHAAMTIQRFYRGASVLHWRDMRLNIISAFVLDRHYVERRARVADSRARYANYIEEVKRDSASDSEDEAEMDVKWVESYDPKLRAPIWINEMTNDVTYEEPRDVMGEKRMLFGSRLRVFWVAQDEWFEGSIVNFHKRKNRFRIDYDDGDHEWIDIYKEKDRIQIQLYDGSWVIFAQYKTDIELTDIEKAEAKRIEDDQKAQAYSDAYQWKILSDPDEHRKLFISDKTGEIRIGIFDAYIWIIQDDGYGYPCFYNIETGAVEYEDPRFANSTTTSLQVQRDFIMQELRYCVYFCKDYLIKYENAIIKKADREIDLVARMIRKSEKPKQLTGFLLRAKALFKHTSVVDKPFDGTVDQELEYASYLAEQLSKIASKAEELRRVHEEGKKKAIQKLIIDRRGGATAAVSNDADYAEVTEIDEIGDEQQQINNTSPGEFISNSAYYYA